MSCIKLMIRILGYKGNFELKDLSQEKHFLCRYVDICLGLSLLLSHVSLSFGSVQERRAAITIFFILSMAVLVLYWVWFAYLKTGE